MGGGSEQPANNHKQLISQDTGLDAEKLDTRRRIAEHRKLHPYSANVAASRTIMQLNAALLHLFSDNVKNHSGAKAKEKAKENLVAKRKETNSNYELTSKEIAFAAGSGDVEPLNVVECGLTRKRLRTLIRKFRMELASGVHKNGSNFLNMADTKRMILMIVVVWINRVNQLSRSLSLPYSLRIHREMTRKIKFGFLDFRRHRESNGRKKIL